MCATVTDAHLIEPAARLRGSDVGAALAQRETFGDLLAYAAWLVALFGVAAVVAASGLPVVASPVVVALVLGAVAATGLGARRAAGQARAWAAGLAVEEQR